MSKQFLSILLILSICFCKFSFSQTASIKEGCAPFTVNFSAPNNTSTPYWQFTDTSFSDLKKPSYTFTSAGVYKVTYKTFKEAIFADTINITVHAMPIALFSTNPNPPLVCAPPLTVTFKNNSDSDLGLEFKWTYNNGNISNDQDLASQKYNSNGDFPVTLEVWSPIVNGCTSSYTRNITVGPPKSIINVGNNVCLNVDAPITNGSSAGFYKWTFTNATLTSSTLFEPKVKFTKPGLQTITLITYSPFDKTCADTVTKQVFVDNPSVSFTSTPTYSCSEPSTVQYTSSTTSANPTYSWTFEDKSKLNQNLPINFSTLPNPSHKYTIPDSIYTKVGRNIFKTVLVMTAPSGCTATFSKNDTIHLPWAKFIPDVAKGCAPLTVVFADSSTSKEPITKWTWYYSKENTPKTNVSFTPTYVPEKKYSHTFAPNPTNPKDTGVFNVRLIIENSKGCRDTSHVVQIQVGDKIVPDFTISDSNPCTADEIQFTNISNAPNIDAWHYSNQNNNVTPNQSNNIPNCYKDANPKWRLNKSFGAQNITLTAEQNGCFSSSASKPITIKGPAATFDYTYDCAKKFDIEVSKKSLNASSTVKWDFGDNTPILSSNKPTETHAYAGVGTYKIVLTAQSTDGCPDTKDSATIEIQDIKADFTISTDILCADVDYTFDASKSTGVNAKCYSGYLWEFEDLNRRPINSASKTEKIKFPTKGKQYVKLTVENVNGCTDTTTRTVRVFNQKPVISSNPKNVCFPRDVQFTNSTVSDTAVVSTIWDFGDKSTGADTKLSDPLHKYNSNGGATGKFIVKFTITDKIGCKNENTLELPIYTPKSTIDLNPRVPNRCIGTTIDFTATDYTAGGSKLSFLWDFGNGKTSTLQNPKGIGWDTAGSYTFKVTYTENSSGCNSSYSENLSFIKTIGLRKDGIMGDTVSIFGGIKDSSYCKEVAPNTIDLEATSKAGREGTWRWFTTDGNILSTKAIGLDTTVATVNKTGTYLLEHKAKFGNCGIDTSYVFVTADTVPTVNLNATVSIDGKKRGLICDTKNATIGVNFNRSGYYQWYYDSALTTKIFDGPKLLSPTKSTTIYTSINSNSAINLLWNVGDTNTFIVEHFNKCGLVRDTLLLEIVPDILSANVTGPLTLCHPIDSVLCLETNDTWHSSTIVYWYTNNTSKPTLFIPDSIVGNKKYYKFNSASYQTKYKADVYNSSCGVFSNEITVNSLFKPDNLTISTPDSTLCSGDSTTIFGKFTKASEPVTFRWFKDGVDMLVTPDTKSIPVKLIAPDSANYRFSVSNVCTLPTDDTLSRSLPIVSDTIPYFFIIARNDTSLCEDGIMDLDYISYIPYEAYPKIWSTGERLESIATTMPGRHSLTITNPNLSACKHTEHYIIPQCDADIFAPSAFTPDENSTNEGFTVVGKGILELNFSIYDRWGIKVFETEDIYGSWNGKINGKDAPVGVYIWNAEYKGNFDGTGVVSRSRRGTVLLIR